MKNRDDSMEWIPLWVDKWIFGSTRIELQPDERAVWVDLMAIASKDNGFIRANPETPYPPQQLAGLLCISEELLSRAIQRCIATGKVKECGNLVENNFTGYYIINWAEYQLSDRHKRRFISNVSENTLMSSKTDTMSQKADAIGEDRIGEDRIGKSDMKPLISSLSQNLTPSKTLDPISRKAELKEQAKFLKEQEKK